MTYQDITKPNLELLVKHGLELIDFEKFMKTCDIQYNINSRASSYYGASLCDRKFLSSQPSESDRMRTEFMTKYTEDPSDCRKRLLDKMNDYALEFYNFRKPLGSPNGRNFW